MTLTGKKCVLDLRRLRSAVALADAAGRISPATPGAVLREQPFLGKLMLYLDARERCSDDAAQID